MARLTKTQKEFRKKMKQLAANGELKDEFGRPIKKVSYYSSFNAKNVLTVIVFVCIVLYYIRPWINLSALSGLISGAGNRTSVYSSDNASSVAPSVFTSQEEISEYIGYTEIINQYSVETSDLIKKYQAGTPYSITEISALRTQYNEILPNIENNCSGTDELKVAAINVIDTNISMLNFLEKNLGIKMTDEAVNEENQIINNINTAARQLTETTKNTLSAAGMPYTETETGIEYSYKTYY